MKCLACIAAESVIRDGETNAMSLVNLREQLNAHSFPVAIGRLSTLVLLERATSEPSKVKCTLDMTLGEQKIGSFDLDVDFEDKPRSRLITVVEGVPVPGPGLFRITVMCNGTETGCWEFPVLHIGQPKATVAQS